MLNKLKFDNDLFILFYFHFFLSETMQGLQGCPIFAALEIERCDGINGSATLFSQISTT